METKHTDLAALLGAMHSSNPDSPDNQRRVLACWNACQNIPTEALEAGVVGELLGRLEQIADEMQSASSQGATVGPDWLDRRIRLARAAIAKAEWGA